MLSDGIIDGADGDEDDHDVASINVPAPVTSTPPTLAFTGVESYQLFLLALLALGAGMAALVARNGMVARKED